MGLLIKHIFCKKSCLCSIVAVPYGIYVIAYFIFSIPFTIVDLTGRPKFIRQYKVQPNENLPVSIDQIKKCIYAVIFNFIVVGLPCECLLYFARVWRGCHDRKMQYDKSEYGSKPEYPILNFIIQMLLVGPFQTERKFNIEREYPWFIVLVFQLIIMGMLFNLIFFYCHYSLHSPKVYKYFHKMHHEWKAPIGISSYYAHPVDHFFVNWLDLAMPPFLIGADSTTITIWYSIALFVIICHHSGYRYPLLPDPEFHDYHHVNFTKNYGDAGVLGLYLDKIHGTLFEKEKKK